MPDEDDLLTGLLESPKPRRIKPTTPHLDVLTQFAKEHNLTVGSTTGGRHNTGSLHYSGNAFDAKGSGALDDAAVKTLSERAAERGIKLRDERRRPRGQKVWGGPHLHFEYAGQDDAPMRSQDDDLLTGIVQESRQSAAPVRAAPKVDVSLPKAFQRVSAGASGERVQPRQPVGMGDVQQASRAQYPTVAEIKREEEQPIGFSRTGQPSRVTQTPDELRVGKGEQPTDRQAYSRQQDVQVRLSQQRDESYREREAREKKDAEFRTRVEPEIANLTKQYRNIIKSSGVGGEQWTGETATKGIAGIGELLAGITDSETLKKHSEAMQRAAEEEGASRDAATKLASDVIGGFIATAPELVAMRLGLPPVATFAGGSALRGGAHTSDPMEIAAAAEHGVGTALAFETPGVGEGTKRLLTKVGGVGGTSAALELATGASPRDALTTGAINAAMAGSGEIGRKSNAKQPAAASDTAQHEANNRQRGTDDRVLPVEEVAALAGQAGAPRVNPKAETVRTAPTAIGEPNARQAETQRQGVQAEQPTKTSQTTRDMESRGRMDSQRSSVETAPTQRPEAAQEPKSTAIEQYKEWLNKTAAELQKRHPNAKIVQAADGSGLEAVELTRGANAVHSKVFEYVKRPDFEAPSSANLPTSEARPAVVEQKKPDLGGFKHGDKVEYELKPSGHIIRGEVIGHEIDRQSQELSLVISSEAGLSRQAPWSLRKIASSAQVEVQPRQENRTPLAVHSENTLSTLREVEGRIERLETEANNRKAPPGTAQAGAADFSSRVKADALMALTREIRKGKSPEEAAGIARRDARELIQQHNQKRPNSVDWQRNESFADGEIDAAVRLMRGESIAKWGTTNFEAEHRTLNVPEIETRLADRIRTRGEVPSAEYTDEGMRRVLGSEKGSLDDLVQVGVIEKTPEGRYQFNRAIIDQASEKQIKGESPNATVEPIVETQPTSSKGKGGEILPEPSVKMSRLAIGVERKAIEAKLTEGFKGLPEYEMVKVKDQAERAARLLENEPERATRIALGKDVPPVDVLPESVFIAVENHALKNGDVNTLRDLATASTLPTEATGMGQRIRMLAERNPNSAVSAMRDVQLARESRAVKQYGNIRKAKNKVITEIQTEIKRTTPKAKDWADFLDSLRC